MTTTDTTPIACVPDAIPAPERAQHAQLARRLFADSGRAEPVDAPAEGYRLELDAAAFGDVARWIANERLCCAFLRFELDVAPVGGAITLTLSGPAGTRAFLDAELSPRGQVAR